MNTGNTIRARRAKAMNARIGKLLGAVALGALLATTGCDHKDKIVAVDPPPFRVDGVYSVTGDFEVTIYWRPNQEFDIAYYKVYRNNAPTGTFHLVGTSTSTSYVDQDVTNGVTYFYAVAAVDDAGQESPELSYENVFDTPRPEGTGESMTNAITADATSGWDFSAYSNRPSLDPATDVFYESSGGHYLLYVPSDTKIQDAGYIALRDVDFAPPAGWSADGIVEAIVGHSYIFYTRDGHYAKLEVRSRGTGGITMDWAYQIDPDNPELARRVP
jgi:hypothetical protein